MGDNLKKAGKWAKSKVAETKSNVADLKDAYAEGGLNAALDTAAGQASEAIDDTTDAVKWAKQTGSDIKEEVGQGEGHDEEADASGEEAPAEDAPAKEFQEEKTPTTVE